MCQDRPDDKDGEDHLETTGMKKVLYPMKNFHRRHPASHASMPFAAGRAW